jgi:murein DD-endopeptidase MepM/ murein hydrolase activator NlpD
MRGNIKYIACLFLCASLLAYLGFIHFASGGVKQELDVINTDIEAKKDQISEINSKIKQYEKNIAQKQKEKLSLANQMEIIEDRIIKAELDVEAAELQIQNTELEIKYLKEQIAEKQESVDEHKKYLSEFVRLMNKEDQKAALEVLLLYDSFSEFFDYVKQLEEINGNLLESLERVKILKTELEANKEQAEEKILALAEEKVKLEARIWALDDQKKIKAELKQQVAESEASFRQMVSELRAEQQKIDNDIASLETKMRKKLEESDKDFANGDGGLVLSWPVDPSRGITATFHDPDYPYRYLFEHPAIDIRAKQGTPVKAAAPGYVAKAYFKGTDYAYVMIIHRAGITTVYGHLSRIIVSTNDFVERGEVIGYSGGMPGTPGAGRLTFGPHLHFETRLNGIPVDPMNYLFQ